MDEKYIVYVRADEAERIVEINSSAFLADTAGWTAIDEGYGDKYHHAQGNYFPLPLYGTDGCANYKLADGTPALRTEAEKAAEIAARPAPEPTPLDRVEAQIAYTAMITDTMLEGYVPFPVSWTVKMKKKQKETQDILSYHTQAAGCSDKARAKASGGRQPIEECGRTGL